MTATLSDLRTLPTDPFLFENGGSIYFYKNNLKFKIAYFKTIVKEDGKGEDLFLAHRPENPKSNADAYVKKLL